MNFFSIRSTIAGIAAAAGLAAFSATGIAADLKMPTPYAGGPWLERDAQGFVDRVNELTEGRVKLRPFPAGALGNALKVTETVQSGAAEAGFNWMPYDWGIEISSVIFGGFAGGLRNPEEYMLWLYKGGGLELWQEYREKKFNVISFPCTTLGSEIFLVSKKKVQTLADFKGLRFRTSGAWIDIAAKLGAATVSMPGGEVYNALDRGVIDATEWGSPEINKPSGLNKIAKYIITPGLHQTGGFLECMFSKDAWAKISDFDKKAIAAAAKLSVFESWLSSSDADLDAFAEIREGRNELVKLDPAFIEAVNKATAEWAKQKSDESEWFKKAYDSMSSYKEKLKLWPNYRLPVGIDTLQ